VSARFKKPVNPTPVQERSYLSPRTRVEADFYVACGAALRRLRIRAGIRQEDAATGIGYWRASLANWESGVQRPSLFTVLSLVERYGSTLEEFLRLVREEQIR
jgi:DNA-binding XRE family transcriptional regulator